MASRQRRAGVVAELGTIDTGKTSRVIRRVREEKLPVMVWDFKGEWQRLIKCRSTDNLAEFVSWSRTLKHNQVIAFLPSHDAKLIAREFDLFCMTVKARGDVLVVVEELKHVTKPSWAPAPWSVLTTTGREWGVQIIGTSQRPAHIDKDFLGNTTEVCSSRLGFKRDREAVAEVFDCHVDKITSLEGFECMLIDRVAGKTVRFTPKKPAR